MMSGAVSGVELRTKITSGGELILSLEDVQIPTLAADEVLIRVEAAPINPSDLGLLVGPADISTLRSTGTSQRPVTTAAIAPHKLSAVARRIDQSFAVGNEGAGRVVQAGVDAQSLLGRTVAARSLGMYSQYRVAKLSECIVFADDITAREAASAFINPLTALGMVETMRAERHKAMVHTAAASNLGQMLVRLCAKEGIALVNIVRSGEQITVLRGLGAKYVLDSTSATFADDLTQALAETGATLAFDAVGGGTLASTILSSMEAALSRTTATYNRYGSPVHKQIYSYGALDTSPTVLNRSYGMAWGIGGWLMTHFVNKIGSEAYQRLRERVAAEIKTTFASQYSAEISLIEALSPEIITAYSQRTTGQKYLIVPNKTV